MSITITQSPKRHLHTACFIIYWDTKILGLINIYNDKETANPEIWREKNLPLFIHVDSLTKHIFRYVNSKCN